MPEWPFLDEALPNCDVLIYRVHLFYSFYLKPPDKYGFNITSYDNGACALSGTLIHTHLIRTCVDDTVLLTLHSLSCRVCHTHYMQYCFGIMLCVVEVSKIHHEEYLVIP